MNIFKPFYQEVKSFLRQYGEFYKKQKFDFEAAEDFDFEKNSKDDKTKKWFYLIRTYLEKYCDEEERKFIKLLYFKNNAISYVAQEIPLCERSCQEWREEIFKNLIALAIQEGVIKIDVV